MSILKVNTIRHTGGSADNITLDSSQNVTIEGTATVDGTTTASAGLKVGSANQTKTVDGVLIERNTGDGYAHITAGRSGGNHAGIMLYAAGASGVTKKLQISPDGTHQIFAQNGTNVNTRVTAAGWLQAKGTASSFSYDNAGPHELKSSTGDNAVLCLIGTTNTAYGISCQLNHSDSSRYAFTAWSTSAGAHQCTIRTNGDIENQNNDYGGYSDIKLKENIVDAKSQWADIKALKFRNFNWKTDSGKKKLLGLVAQEAETVCPNLVKNQRDVDAIGKDLGTETKVLKYSVLYMKAMKALQESMERIEALETKVAALEAG